MLVESERGYFHNDIRHHFEGHNNENLYGEILTTLIHASLKIKTYRGTETLGSERLKWYLYLSEGNLRKVPASLKTAAVY